MPGLESSRFCFLTLSFLRFSWRIRVGHHWGRSGAPMGQEWDGVQRENTGGWGYNRWGTLGQGAYTAKPSHFNTAKALGCGILSRHASLRRAPMRHAPMSRLHTLRTSVDHMRSLKAPSFPSLPESSPSAICPPPAMMHYVWMCPPLVDIST